MTRQLCGARHFSTPFRCTRPIGHLGDHIATMGPYELEAPTLARWHAYGDAAAIANDSDPSRHNFAIDREGRPLPHTSDETRAIVLKMIDEGEIMAVVVRRGGDLGVQVFGPPTRELLDVLETATTAYRRALQGH